MFPLSSNSQLKYLLSSAYTFSAPSFNFLDSGRTPVGSAKASLRNAFTSAGINQTRHEIRLVVDVYVSVLLPGFSTVTKVTNRCAVAETVIVGSVPDTYTYFDTREDMSSTAEDFIMNNAG